MNDQMRTYILYDSRACDGTGTSNASVLIVCDDEEEAKEDSEDFGDCACYSYLERDGEFVDERFEWNRFDS